MLDWIGGSASDPAEVYEDIRQRLIRFFFSKGCWEAEDLADETFERVRKQVEGLVQTYEGNPKLYFYGVARNVFRESTRKPKPVELPEQIAHKEAAEESEAEKHDQCLESCLGKLDQEDRRFILSYYEGEKSKKIENRQRLMERFDISPQALRVRAFRLRARLQRCVFKCAGIEKAA
ncbi:MAG: sigma-70 family RNA polymerase sigma factor [Pyrinomonadaceae bacterium]